MTAVNTSSRRFGLLDVLNIFSVAAVGVTFVLFIIFVVASPLHRHTTVDRPDGGSASPIERTEHDLYMVIDADSRIRVGPQFVNDAELAPYLREIQMRGPRRLMLEADRRATYEAVEKVVRAAREVGFQEIRMLTGPHDVLEALERESRKAKALR